MKKLIYLIVTLLLVVACGSDTTEPSETQSTTGTFIVESVSGEPIQFNQILSIVDGVDSLQTGVTTAMLEIPFEASDSVCIAATFTELAQVSIVTADTTLIEGGLSSASIHLKL